MNGMALVHEDSVVLVSGGGRGITARCVVELAKRSRCKFILLGRSSPEIPAVGFPLDGCDDTELKRRIAADLKERGEKPLPARIQKMFSAIRSGQEISATLDAVAAAGGQAEYVRVDVADPALGDALAGPVERLGPVTGIIHGAGALVDKLIERKTESDFETVYTPKVTGLDNLMHSVDPRRLDFLVLFSSIVGFFGNVGQADYAIANEILNKSAYLIKHEYPNCHVISINWGPWDSGMVTPELKKLFQERHVDVISSEAGARVLVDALLPAQSGTDGGPVQVVVGSAPALPASRVEGDLRHYEIRRRLTADDNPFLYDHTIGGHPVLPATCAAAWAAYSCEQLYPGFRFFQLENYRVLKGIVFDDSLADEHILDLTEVEKSDEAIVFDALVRSQNRKGRPIYHYRLRVTLRREAPVPPVFALAAGDAETIPGSQLYEDGTLFHGPAFQGVERVLHISRGKLVMQVMLPQIADRIQGQFPTYTANPFIYDAIVQCLLIWAQYFYEAPCLPSSLRRLEQFKPIPFGVPCRVTLEVESQSSTAVVGNILVQDDQGATYVRLDGLEGTISPHLNRFIGKRAEGAGAG